MTLNKTMVCLDDSMIPSGVEFVGIINKKGRLVETIGKDLLCDMPRDIKEMFCMNIALRGSMQKDFDEYLGPVNYCMTQRGNTKFISIPAVNGNTILGITKKKVEPSGVVGCVTQMLQSSNQYPADDDKISYTLNSIKNQKILEKLPAAVL